MSSHPSSTSNSALGELRRATHEAHLRLHVHSSFAQLVDGHIGRDEYLVLLARLYGFHKPLEELLLSAPCEWWYGLDLEPRQRAHLLARDLASLGMSEQELESLPLATPAAIDAPGKLFGCLYVREGSTLGAKLLARKLDHLFGTGESGRSFLAGNNDHAEQWRQCCDGIERAADAGHLPTMTAAAVATFATFETWISG